MTNPAHKLRRKPCFDAPIDALYHDRERARVMGSTGQEKVREVTWDRVIERLTGVVG